MNKREREQMERNRLERSWALFENRERWRQAAAIYRTLGAAQKLRLKREHPAAYAWMQKNA